MSVIEASSIVVAALLSPCASRVLYRLNRRTCHFYRGWIGGGVCGALSWAAGGNWPAAAVSIANAILAAVLWWLSRRRRKRAPRAYGAKSRALVAAVVAKMRQSLKPRPVLRPMPGRAG